MPESPKDFIKRHAPRKAPDPARASKSPKEFLKWLRQRQLAALPQPPPDHAPEP
jgi:hypothetical protein